MFQNIKHMLAQFDHGLAGGEYTLAATLRRYEELVTSRLKAEGRSS